MQALHDDRMTRLREEMIKARENDVVRGVPVCGHCCLRIARAAWLCAQQSSDVAFRTRMVPRTTTPHSAVRTHSTWLRADALVEPFQCTPFVPLNFTLCCGAQAIIERRKAKHVSTLVGGHDRAFGELRAYFREVGMLPGQVFCTLAIVLSALIYREAALVLTPGSNLDYRIASEPCTSADSLRSAHPTTEFHCARISFPGDARELRSHQVAEGRGRGAEAARGWGRARHVRYRCGKQTHVRAHA